VASDFLASRYVQTDILQEVLEILEDNGMVVLYGVPGCGKSYQGKSVLRHYRNLGYKVYMLQTFKDWNKHVGEGRKCVVLMDMTFGIECVLEA
jgi:SpoVK/Ycf46/Vps4 family AAA+-type ATPase